MTQDFDPGGFSVTIAPAGIGQRLPDENNVTIRAFPMAFMDNQFVLSQNQPAVLRLALNNAPEVKVGQLTVFLDLPSDIKLLATGKNKTWKSQPVSDQIVRHEISVGRPASNIPAGGYDIVTALALMLQTTAAPGTEWPGRYCYWLSNDDYVSPRIPLTFKVIPTIQAPRPKRFQSGAHFTAGCVSFDGQAAQDLADFYVQTGCNAAMVIPGIMSQNLRARQVIRYHQPPGWLVNGCMVGKPPRPPEVQFQYKDGSKTSTGVCPAVIYRQEEPYYTANLLEPLRKILVVDRDTDHFLCNWEPFMFDFKGCFCERCQTDFQKFAKLPEAEVAEVWPNTVIEKHRDLWINFRAWQNAELVYTVEKLVQKLGREAGVEAHFIPEVHIKSITQLWNTSGSLRQYATMAYAGQIPVLNAWGPYPWQTIMHPYNYVRGYNLSTHCLTRDSVDYLRAELPPARQPKLLGFPHGMQTNKWTTEPESIAIDILTYFLNEYDGQLVYAFPKGYDARFWHALAEANKAIAAFEDYTLDGVAEKSHQVELLTPYPEASPRFLKAPCGGIDEKRWADASMLQTWEYRLGETRLLALANYWQRGECLVRLSFPQCADGATYALQEPLHSRTYGAESGNGALSAAQLREGITIHVGGQRVVFLLLSPSSALPAGTAVVRPSQMASLLAERLPQIKASFAAEKPELGLAAFQKSLQAFQPLQQADWSIKRVQEPTLKRDVLQLSSGEQVLALDVLGGGRICSWQVNGNEVVWRDQDSGLALDGLWYPALMLTGPMQLGKVEIKGRDAIVNLRLPSIDQLPGVELAKTLTFSASQQSFTVQTTVRNDGSAPVTFSHRYHNMVRALAKIEEKFGSGTFSGQPELKFERQFVRQMFLRKGAPIDNMLTKAFEMGKINEFAATAITFVAEHTPVALQATLPAKDLHSVAFWDSQAMVCPTFEPIHSQITLAPGEKWQTNMKWTTIKK